MWRIYFDVCCLNRPLDDQTQRRIHLEAVAVLRILRHVAIGAGQWTSSEAVSFEVERITDSVRRSRVQFLLALAGDLVVVTQNERERQDTLEALGLQPLDALHVACAESAEVDALLTTDDRLVRLAARHATELRVRVVNPLTWSAEVGIGE